MSLTEKIETFLEGSYAGKDTAVYRDLSLNLKKVLDDSSPLDLKEKLISSQNIKVAREINPCWIASIS